MQVKIEQHDLQHINQNQNLNQNLNQNKNGEDDGFEVIEEQPKEESVQKLNQKEKEKVANAGPYVTDISLFDKDFYRNPYLVREKKNQDTVKLGSKTWKPNEAQKKKNQEIDKAKKISKNATAHTLMVYEAVKNTNLRYGNVGLNPVGWKRRLKASLSKVRFTAKMFTSAYIAKHYKDSYEIVQSYMAAMMLAQNDKKFMEDLNLSIENTELFDLFTKRINEFTKKNAVDMETGEGTKASLRKDEKVTDADYDRWLILTGEAKLQRNEKRLNKVLKDVTEIELKDKELEQTKADPIKVDYNDIQKDANDYGNMKPGERIAAIPEMKGIIDTIRNEIGERPSKDVDIVLRKELAEMKAVLRLANAELKLYEAGGKGADPEELKKNFPTEVKELYAASEDMRRIQKRYISDGLSVSGVTAPKGIVKLSREEAMSTHSDRLSMQKRLNILSLSDKSVKSLNEGNEIKKGAKNASELNELIRKYFHKNFYKVGDREEAKAMKKVMKYIKDNKLRDNPEFSELIKEIDSMTNGSLEFDPKNLPKGAVYLDKADPNGTTRPFTMDYSTMKSNTFIKVQKVLETFTKWEDRKDEPLFAHEPTVNDLRQGKVSNCWMVSATTALINVNPNIVKDALKDNGDGTVTVRLYTKVKDTKEGKWNTVPNYIRVKKEVPKLVGGSAVHTSGALWMQMLEKAAAFIGYKKPGEQNPMAGYSALWHGTQGNWLFALTGVEEELIASTGFAHIGMQINNGNLEGFTEVAGGTSVHDLEKNERFVSELYNDILHAREKGILYTYGSKMGGNIGLNDGHAYTVMGAKEVNGQRYIILRNPYGNMNAVYDEKGKMHRTESYFTSSMNETYGQFMIKIEDFLADGGCFSRFDTKKIGKKEEIEKENQPEQKVVEEFNPEGNDF